jgi:uncharacterized protein
MITRRRFLCTLLGAGLGGAAWDFRTHETPFPSACRVRTTTVPAPAGWSGKTALFVTDIHYGNLFGPPEAAALNALVRRAAPAVVLLGGDLANTPRTDLAGFLAAWAPGCPTFFSPGNHDLDFRARGTILDQARAGGLEVLSNATVTWDGVTLIGLPSALRERQRLSLLAAPGLKIVLGHEPDEWDRYRPPDLLHLAGHTHGGQIRLFGRPVRLPDLGKKYPLGVYSRPGSTLVVSAGIGYTEVPVRLNCPPQIIRLRFV